MSELSHARFNRNAFSDRHSREDAERAIETALLVLEHKRLTADQLSDLADAVDAFKEQAYPVAVALALAAMRQKREVATHTRAPELAETWDDIKDKFAEARHAGAPAFMATPIVNARFEIVGWTYKGPQVVRNNLVHPEAECLVAGPIVSRQVQLVNADDIVRAGGPRLWSGPWRCYALCSAAVGPITAMDFFPVVASTNSIDHPVPILGGIEPAQRKRGRRPSRSNRDAP